MSGTGARPLADLRWGAITDVPGIRVGQAERIGGGWLTGVSVVLPPPGTVGAVDVRGGGPGTHETDALDPCTLVPTVDAVTLTGGSAYGLASAGGVQRWCEQAGRGFPVGPAEAPTSLLVPIVPAAALFDLGRGGDPAARPDAELGLAAAEAAGAAEPGTSPARGCVGAGTGAELAGGALKGGIGTASIQLPGGIVVGAIAAVNAFGVPVDPLTGGLLGAAFIPADRWRPPVPTGDEATRLRAALAGARSRSGRRPAAANTTLAVVATNAALDPARARRTATAAHDGLARTLTPVHTLLDGDTVFVLATGEREVDLPALIAVQAAAADAVLLAVLDAVLSARQVGAAPQGPAAPDRPATPDGPATKGASARLPARTVPGYADLCPSVLATGGR